MKKFIFITLIFLGLSQVFAASQDENASGVERYAIYIGSNKGGQGREKLLYAGSDAKNFQKTMAEIGGVTDANSYILIDPSKESIDQTLNQISEKIRTSQSTAKRSEFIFYYSGHSDENALLLGDTPYDYSTLKAAITDVPSDIHVVILDSCYSGNFIRTKGGQKRKPFLLDDSSVVTGHAYLSSSSDNEFSQESDEIESSFFTNAMITGLRGAADTSGDNKVTLNELYSYAFNDTLSKTESSKAGPQHPNFNITLVGSGDLILSDISTAEAMLSLSKDSKGRFIIRNAQGKLISEINKVEGQPIFMALPAGQYTAVIIDDYSTKQGTFLLDKDQIFVLDQNSLGAIKRKSNRLRGSASDDDFEDFDDGDGEILSTENLGNSQRSRRQRRLNPNAAEGTTIILDSSIHPVTETEEDSEVLENDFEAPEDEFEFPPFSLDESDIFHFALVPGFTFLKVDGTKDTTFLSVGILGSLENNVMGFQLSNIMNISSGYVYGIQNAGIFNISKDLLGLQTSGVFNIAKNASGVQASGVFNIAHGNVNGAQLTGLFNTSSGTINGAQVSGFGNFAKTVEGAQVSGFLNVAKKIDGIQIGVINIAEDNNGIALGLFNFIKNGVHDFGISWNTNDMFDFFYQSGTNSLFFTIGAEASRLCLFDRQKASFVESRTGIVYGGLGSRLAMPFLSFDFEFLWKFFWGYYENEVRRKARIDDFVTGNIPSLRFTVNASPTKHLSAFAGVSCDINIHDYNEEVFRYLNTKMSVDFNDNVTLKPAFFFGLKIK